MSTTQILPDPPTALLKAAHKRLRELFTRFNSLAPAERRVRKRLLREIQEGLRIHLEIEEILFYPAVQAMKADLAITVVMKALKDHAQVKARLEALVKLDSEEQPLDAGMDDLQDCVLAHLKAEEMEIFPYARALPSETLQQLGADMEKLRDRLQAHAVGPDRPSDSRHPG